MYLTSFFANKCLEYLLTEDKKTSEQGEEGLKNEIFPPWALHPKAFKKSCTGCGECAAACKEHLIIIEENGLPAMDFSQGTCSFCGDCARSCPSGALFFFSGTVSLASACFHYSGLPDGEKKSSAGSARNNVITARLFFQRGDRMRVLLKFCWKIVRVAAPALHGARLMLFPFTILKSYSYEYFRYSYPVFP